MAQALANEKFELTLEDGSKVIMRCELQKSGAFQYGNQTMMAQYEGDRLVNTYDTRYVKGCGSPEAFHEWAFEFVKEYVRPTIKVARYYDLVPMPGLEKIMEAEG